MIQPDLLSWVPPVILGDRDGISFEPKKDRKRLNKQAQAVYNLMADKRWRTLAEISAATGAPEASASARLRDWRKPKFGGYQVDRRRRADAGTWEYRLADA